MQVVVFAKCILLFLLVKAEGFCTKLLYFYTLPLFLFKFFADFSGTLNLETHESGGWVGVGGYGFRETINMVG